MNTLANTIDKKRFTLKKQQIIFHGVFYFTLACALLVVLIFVGILFCLISGSMPAFHAFGMRFLLSNTWDPVNNQFGAAGSVIGTLVTSFIALLIAIPMSFGISVFILKIAPRWLAKPLRIIVDLLAGIPSIIYGMWGLFSLAPIIGAMQPWIIDKLGSLPMIGFLFQGPQIGIGLFTAGIVLGIMVIPFIASIMHDVLELVPSMLQESSYALGATTWETIWKVMVPYGRIGLIGGIMLGLGRALGETMAVAFVIGNAHTMATALFVPADSIASTLANEFTEANAKIYSSALIELGLYLFIVTTIVLFLSRLLLQFIRRQPGN